MVICVDFDGTCVTHEFPKVGKDIGAANVLKRLVQNGHLLVLFTMRSDGSNIQDALDWFDKNRIPLYGINENPTQKEWTSSKKAYGNYYIDDAAIGVPLIYDKSIAERPFVDWNKVEKILEEMGLI
jgi:hypothetical protein